MGRHVCFALWLTPYISLIFLQLLNNSLKCSALELKAVRITRQDLELREVSSSEWHKLAYGLYSDEVARELADEAPSNVHQNTQTGIHKDRGSRYVVGQGSLVFASKISSLRKAVERNQGYTLNVGGVRRNALYEKYAIMQGGNICKQKGSSTVGLLLIKKKSSNLLREHIPSDNQDEKVFVWEDREFSNCKCTFQDSFFVVCGEKRYAMGASSSSHFHASPHGSPHASPHRSPQASSVRSRLSSAGGAKSTSMGLSNSQYIDSGGGGGGSTGIDSPLDEEEDESEVTQISSIGGAPGEGKGKMMSLSGFAPTTMTSDTGDFGGGGGAVGVGLVGGDGGGGGGGKKIGTGGVIRHVDGMHVYDPHPENMVQGDGLIGGPSQSGNFGRTLNKPDVQGNTGFDVPDVGHVHFHDTRDRPVTYGGSMSDVSGSYSGSGSSGGSGSYGSGSSGGSGSYGSSAGSGSGSYGSGSGSYGSGSGSYGSGSGSYGSGSGSDGSSGSRSGSRSY